MAERYALKGVFGSRAALNSTSACTECGAVVYDTEAHDRWHTAQPIETEERDG